MKLEVVTEQRRRAVLQAISSIRAIEKTQGITRDSLKSIRAVLLELVAHTDLFPESDFVPKMDDQGLYPLYRLAEDDDHRLAMYINSSVGTNDVPPHNHTTWAVTVSVLGSEENRFYELVTQDSASRQAQLRQIGVETVRPGVGICMMPDDIHSVHAKNDETALVLHMYGKALDHLPNRTNYDIASGTYRVSLPTLNIVEAR